MGKLTQPQTKTVDPTPDAVKGVQGDVGRFLQGLLGIQPGQTAPGGFSAANGGLQNPFAGMTSPLQKMGVGGVQQFLNQNPEQQTFDMLQNGLMGMFGANNAQAVGQAAMPLFQQGLQFAQGGLASSAPGRFSTAFQNQGIGLGQRALQDFNLLQQQAFQQDQQNRLAAGGLLGQLASQAGSGAFGRNLQAAQLGTQQTMNSVNPILQLLLGGMGFTQPTAKETIVGKSPLDTITDVGTGAFLLNSMRGGGQQPQP